MSNLTFTKLSWEDLQKDCFELFQTIKDIKIDAIISISRGGLVVARIISDLMDFPVSHISISSYKNLQEQKKLSITETPSTNFKDKTIIIIDEVSDTGETFKHACEHFQKMSPKKIYTLAPYIKPHTTFVPDFWVKKMDSWIIFPYEVKETIDAFVKMFQSKEHAREKLIEVGFKEWEIDAVLS